MRENRSYGLEGGESGSTGLPYPYRPGRGGLLAILAGAIGAWHRFGAPIC